MPSWPPCAPMAGIAAAPPAAGGQGLCAHGRVRCGDRALVRGGQLGETMPERLVVSATRPQRLRYGENPHQQAAFYVTDRQRGIGAAEQVQGKELSYNNLADADAALELVCAFSEPAVAIIKHANPCGVAIGQSLEQAYAEGARLRSGQRLWRHRGAQPPPGRRRPPSRSPRLFTEVVIAPDAEADARALLAAKPNLRLLLTGALAAPPDELLLRSVAGGLLVQERDAASVDDLELKVVTERAPTPAEIADLRFAFAVCKHVRSNAIVFARDGATVGIGAGQMSRLDSVAIAARKAAEVAQRGRRGRARHRRQRGRLGCLLPVRRRARGGAPGGRHRRDPARRQHAR